MDEAAVERLVAFGAALSHARTLLKMSQTELAARIHRDQTAVSRYEKGEQTPEPDVVFSIEVVLGLEAGALSKYLGYVPVDTSCFQQVMNVIDAIQNDPLLSPQTKRMLISSYRQAASG